ncbi:Rho GTPase, putative [Entamoeba invadens IP1]|uniref:small monomeric GTPase n=1 Tax=Entamoeba invadens IP1 TaxID=370355 RepID=A0A0A1U987_ENTIV|nr:Rho GTPase, putative [Entamoeba invadens IP1]ELP91479.1 Rho GTPase, putative [Entamoeba invadens IP1]|eukprot:XP_004258250.1 Rho GTPase, putative [Entamoeba invadens IP1]
MVQQKIKLLFNGDSSVGKTSLLIKYTTGEFPYEYTPTVFDNYTINVTYNNIQIDMELWDTGGQEDYPPMRPLSYYNTSCFVLCFSLVYMDSYKSLKTLWLPEIKQYNPNTPILLIGFKSDLRESNGNIESDFPQGIYQRITTEQGLQMAKDIGAMGYIECSTINDINVNMVFEKAKKISYEYLYTCMNTKKHDNKDCILC